MSAQSAEKKRHPWGRVILALSTVLVLALGAAGFYVVQGLNALNKVVREPSMMPTSTTRPTTSAPQPDAPAAPMNFVLMGSDTRGDERGRSDVLLVAHLNGARDELYLISFPRDMYVPIPGHGKNKINAAYSFGGSSLAVETLESLLDVRMDHAAVIDFEGFLGLSEEVDGVTLKNKIASKADGFTFPKGEITLKGDELLSYVRQRHGLPGGDLDRAERHRAVIKALVLKLLRPETLANPATFNKVASRIGGYFTVDDELTNEAIFGLATSLKLEGGGSIRSLQAPISGFGRSPLGASIDIVDFEKLDELATAMREDDMAAFWERSH
jgi:LCP family protein required for cell wall assembly